MLRDQFGFVFRKVLTQSYTLISGEFVMTLQRIRRSNESWISLPFSKVQAVTQIAMTAANAANNRSTLPIVRRVSSSGSYLLVGLVVALACPLGVPSHAGRQLHVDLRVGQSGAKAKTAFRT
jgi:hypothetical protein